MEKSIDYARLAELSTTLHILSQQNLLSKQRERELIEAINQEVQLSIEHVLICPVCAKKRTVEVNTSPTDISNSPFEIAKKQLTQRAQIMFQILQESQGQYFTSEELTSALIHNGVQTRNQYAIRMQIGGLVTEINKEMERFGSVAKQPHNGSKREKEYGWEPRIELQNLQSEEDVDTSV